MALSPIALGLQLMGVLLLPAGLLYGIAIPMCVLFTACLIKFPLDTKIITTVCVGGLFILTFHVLKSIREKQQPRGPYTQPGAAAYSTLEHRHSGGRVTSSLY
ncbi:MAG: hypothetical protein B7Z37_13535 [Verrucomicrobia bacterium 12-59-8]|nr:MAG: hypothetical protein B7Z37_13535 [Verrucomicrobia bacterium 12-59-8]